MGETAGWDLRASRFGDEHMRLGLLLSPRLLFEGRLFLFFAFYGFRPLRRK